MQAFKKAVIYGFLVWLIPFFFSVLISPLRTSNRPLFESVMPVIVTISVVLFAILHFRKVELHFLKQGVTLGLMWFVISLGIDLVMFTWGPMAMSFVDYMMDIGLTYLIIPTVTIGLGYLMEGRCK